jgi:hypothetical protein
MGCGKLSIYVPALFQRPTPQVAVLYVVQEARNGSIRVEELPGEYRTAA